MTSRMTFGVVIRPQHHSWAAMSAEWAEAEAIGFDSIWTNDHFYSLLGPHDREAFEAQTTLAAIAHSTSKVRFGAMTYSVTAPQSRRALQAGRDPGSHERGPGNARDRRRLG